jgi:hypothetical protein
MKEQLYYLDKLLEQLTLSDWSKSFSELNRVLEKYTKILDFVNGYSDTYRIATSVYYTDINSIRDNIQRSLYAKSQQEKDLAFKNARNELKKDIQALLTLIKPAPELSGITI